LGFTLRRCLWAGRRVGQPVQERALLGRCPPTALGELRVRVTDVAGDHAEGLQRVVAELDHRVGRGHGLLQTSMTPMSDTTRDQYACVAANPPPSAVDQCSAPRLRPGYDRRARCRFLSRQGMAPSVRRASCPWPPAWSWG